MEAVEHVLADLDLTSIPRLIVMNKTDKLDPSKLNGFAIALTPSPSAPQTEGLGRLMETAEAKLRMTHHA